MADYKIDPGLVCPIEASHANLFIEDRSVEVRHMNWLYNTRKQEQVAGEVRVVKKPLDDNHQLIVNHTILEYHGFDQHEYEDGSMYLGQWLGGIRVGQGVMQFPDGSKYEGEFAGDNMQGLGKYTFASGNTYIGQYNIGKREGMGRYKWQNSGQLYNGMWEDDRRSGSGTHFWDDAALYQGKWIMGLQEFNGVFDWPDGRRYIGEVKNGMRHGYGISVAQNGAKIANVWKNGRPTQALDIVKSDAVRVGYTAAIVSANEAKMLYTVGSYVYRMAEDKAKEARRMVDTWKRLAGLDERTGLPKGPARTQLVSGPLSTMKPPLQVKVDYLKELFLKEADEVAKKKEEERNRRREKKSFFGKMFGKKDNEKEKSKEAEMKGSEDMMSADEQLQLEKQAAASRLVRRTDNSGHSMEDAAAPRDRDIEFAV
mmetsp:Transcript_874/g.1543  ORF Transcript_874/g.1543 Transcript_874/m.1543 type:complete len:426 (+) Transcript_874:467-1744(+)|eukprot:CAMPEP_0198227940 /NCGR_PEP_ID=MMETSP1445-20131203/111288_1 /TAXON_ID=36898 /ORGANISM="Pyramimonas sp., Strain CCMP2087" /LENGTH=425 /DNA_ID=CAMNT_0043908147 /DNA_START=398 /DNA_END=1675 /DNA_ORIENTATION=-